MPDLSSALPGAIAPLGFGRLGDERLARLVSAGRERAFTTIYERYHQQLYRYCRSMLANDSDAQDALQSTLVSALGALRAGRRNAPLRPWLFRIAHNESIDLIRRRRYGEELSEELLSPAPSAEDCAGERARLAVLVADLATLPERQRGALLMRELSGLSHEDIAVAIGASVGAAKQAIFEARSSLAELADGRAMPCEEVRRTISDGDQRSLRGRRIRAHLRDCAACAAFAEAIPARSHDLRALVPMLPPAASAALLMRCGRGASGHGTTGGASAGTLGGSTTGTTSVGLLSKAGGAALASKAAVGAAVLVSAAGVGTATRVLVNHLSGSGSSASAGAARHGSAGAKSPRGAGASSAALVRVRGGSDSDAAAAAAVAQRRLGISRLAASTHKSAHSGAGQGSLTAKSGTPANGGHGSVTSTSNPGHGGYSPGNPGHTTGKPSDPGAGGRAHPTGKPLTHTPPPHPPQAQGQGHGQGTPPPNAHGNNPQGNGTPINSGLHGTNNPNTVLHGKKPPPPTVTTPST
jgi:RNA polymerase sigma factor (sigma-70 family)